MKGLFQCPPWARSFCPFRACCCGLLGLLGVAAVGFLAFWALLLWASWPFGRCCLYGLLGVLLGLLGLLGVAAVGFLAFWVCCWVFLAFWACCCGTFEPSPILETC